MMLTLFFLSPLYLSIHLCMYVSMYVCIYVYTGLMIGTVDDIQKLQIQTVPLGMYVCMYVCIHVLYVWMDGCKVYATCFTPLVSI